MPRKARGGYTRLEKSLEEKKLRLLEEIRQNVFKRLREEHADRYAHAMDAGDQSVASLLETLGFQLAAVRQREVQKIEEAEKKIRNGTYGFCESCGEWIGKERLAAVPSSAYCLECMDRMESAGAVEAKPKL